MKHIVGREDVTEYGRTDIQLWFGEGHEVRKEAAHGLLVIEVKTKPPGDDLAAQLKRYEKWARKQAAPRKLFVYVGLEAPAEDTTPFLPITWEALARRLRQHANRLGGPDLMRAAAVLIFCGAVEQNLLAISARPPRFRAIASVDYLQNWQEKGNDEH